ncbi:hypothetical protein PMIN01_04279 [Paraphaeosphaeria minitans]|uniref:Uncharacterized protein n=1 Tax=Paraphaeosphaeria minitans TaxID=565426 RepID=A0A9P6GK83_9PLEO|nr:hypothetical protein PMIN01_04279 [Paraphaeosphaeria minitans]
MAHINSTKTNIRSTTVPVECSRISTASPSREVVAAGVPDPSFELDDPVSVVVPSAVAVSSDADGSDVAVGDDISSEAFDLHSASGKGRHAETANPQTDPGGHNQSSSAETHCFEGFGALCNLSSARSSAT